MDTVLTGLGLVVVFAVGTALGALLIGYINVALERHRHKGHKDDLDAMLQGMKDAFDVQDPASFPEGAIISTEEL
jgi:hypothetical protein